MNYRKIDWGIRSFVRELNNKGFKTLFSCAGHKSSSDGTGYVTVKGYSGKTIENLRKIAMKHTDCPKVKMLRMSWNDDGMHKTMRVTNIVFLAKNLTKSPGWDGEAI